MEEGLTSSKVTRSSRACLACRSRHLKCDGKQPCCSRCVSTARECHYTRSRRGGLDRAVLAERRKRLAAGATAAPRIPSLRPPADPPQGENAPRSDMADIPSGSSLLGGNSTTSFDTSPQSPMELEVLSIDGDVLIDAYYKHFHKLHPFILQQKHLNRLYQDPSRQPSFRPLIAILRFVGYIVGSGEWSIPLKDYAEKCFSQASSEDPIMVQCRLLFSMMLFWYGHTADSKREMDAAVQLAVNLGMAHREFAANHAADELVLQESWRRTWWALCVADVYYAGTLGTTKFVAVNLETSVDLPCEEWEYESGEIPEPKTLQDFESREFAPEDTAFSSFAYLIGAVRSEALAMSTAPRTAIREGSATVIQIADSLLEGWLLLLPPNCKQPMTSTGEVDELMFQAHMLIHIATISLHRPFSSLPFNPVEETSSCAREPPSPNTATAADLVTIHTLRVLRAVNSQVRLLALPHHQFIHTPFVTCMISGGTLALLSACNFLLKDEELDVGRGQIRLMIARLKTLAETWPRTLKNLREIQTIARRVLGVGRTSGASFSSPATATERRDSSAAVEGLEGEGAKMVTHSNDARAIIPSSPRTIEDLAGWCSTPGINLDLDFLWGVCNGSEFTI